MNNLMIITSRFPHAGDSVRGIFVFSLVEELKKHFEKVVVISTTPYTPKFLTRWMKPKRKRDALARDYKYDNVEVYYTKNIVLPIEFLKRFRGKAGYRSAVSILQKIKFKPDIIHAHFTWPSGYVAMKMKEIYEIPYLLTAHGYDVYDLPFRSKYYNMKVKEVLRNADYIITVSQKNKEILVKKINVPTEKITVIPNGFDPKLFHPLDKIECRRKLNLPLNKKIVLSVGNLLPVKGHIYLVDAAKEILKTEKEILFLIIGEGSEEKKLKDRIMEYNLHNNFLLASAKNHNEIPLWMNASDIFVLPSLNEGVPTVLFEAIGSGKPVVGTAVGGIPEIINDERLGILVPTSDGEALASAILDGLDKDWDNAYIANTAKKYSWQKIAEEIMTVYDCVLEKPTSNKGNGPNTEWGNSQ